MKKLVLKTAAITLSALVGIGLISFGIVALAAPGTMARFFDDLGNYRTALYFYEKQYEKTEDIFDLNDVIMKIDKEKDFAAAEKYLSEMINHPDFDAFCAVEDEENDGYSLSSAGYYCGEYALARVRAEYDFTETVELMKQFAEKYRVYSPFHTVLGEEGGSLGKERLSALRDGIEQVIGGGNISDEDKASAEADLKKINSLLENIKE